MADDAALQALRQDVGELALAVKKLADVVEEILQGSVMFSDPEDVRSAGITAQGVGRRNRG